MTANFAGTAGTVTIGSGLTINANVINITTGNYIIAGADGTALLNLDGAAPVINATTGNSTISAIVGGGAGFSKTGAGRLALTGANTFTGTAAINGGFLRADDGVGLSSGSNLLISNGGFETDTNFTRSLGTGSGQVRLVASGANVSTGFGSAGNVVVALGGVATPTGLTWGSADFTPSTGTGAFAFNAGSIATGTVDFRNAIDLNDTGSAVSRRISVTNGTAILSGNLTQSGTGAASLEKQGGGLLALTGTNSYSGSTTVSAGTLRADDGVGLSSGSLLALNGGVYQDTGGSFTRSLGTGAGQVRIAGGTSGFSAYGQDLVVALGGTGSPTALTWGSTNFNPGTLVLNAGSADANVDFRNAIDLNNGLADVTRTIQVSANTATLGGVLSDSSFDTEGAVASLAKTGAGVLVLGAANTYHGVTTVSAGTLQLGHEEAIQNSSSVTIGADAVFDLNGYSIGQDIVFQGTAASNAVSRLRNTSATEAVVSGDVSGFSVSRRLTVDGSGNIEISGDFTGTLAKGGTGTLLLTGNNNLYNITSENDEGSSVRRTVAITLSGGHLALGSDNALAGGGSLFFGSNNANVASFISAAGGARTISNTVTANVGTNTNEGAIVVTGENDLTFAGAVSNSRPSGNLAITVNNRGTTTFNGGISVSGGSASFFLQGSGNILVDSDFTRGTAGSGVTLTYSGPGTLSLSSSGNDMVNLLSAGGMVRISGLNTIVGANALGTRGGHIVLDLETGNDRWNTASAVSLGGGSLTIEGASTGTSSQTLGNLTLAYGSSRIVVDASTGSGTGLTLGNTWTRSNNATTLIDLSASGSSLVSSPALTNGLIVSGGAYALVKDSSGIGFATVDSGNVVRYTGASTLAADSNASTTNFKADGNLTLTDADRSINTLQIDTSADGGTLDLGTTGTARRLSLTNRSVLMTGSNDYAIANGILGVSATELILFNHGTGTLAIDALIGNTTANTASVIKAGTGLVVLNGSQVYTGVTQIQEGALQAHEGNSLGTGNLQLAGGVLQSTGTFARNLGTAAGQIRWNAGDAANQAGGGFAASTGTLAIQLNGGTGTLQWGATNFVQSGRALIFGSTTADGVVDFQNGLDLGPLGGPSGSGNTRTITVVDNAGSENDKAVISGNISSTGLDIGILKNGTGILELTGNNIYSGTTWIRQGILKVNNTAGSATGTGTVLVQGISSADYGRLGGGSGASNGGTLNTLASASYQTYQSGVGSIAGKVAVEANGRLAPGNSVGTLTVDSLTLENGSILEYEFNLAMDSNDFVVVNAEDGLTLNGGIFYLYQEGTTTAFGELGTFNLFAYEGDLQGSLSNLSVGNGLGGYEYSFINNSAAGLVQLNITAVPEPSTYALLTGGLVALFFLRRKRSSC